MGFFMHVEQNMKNISVIFFLISTAIWSQVDHVSQIVQYWESYKLAFLENDFRKGASLANPMVVKKTGGETYFMDDLLYDEGMYES